MLADPSFVSRLDRRRIVSRINSRIDWKSNHGAWQSQGMALIGHHRSRTFGREHRPPPNLDSYLITAWDDQWPRYLAGGFLLRKSHPSQSLAGAACHRPTQECQRPRALLAIASRQIACPPATPALSPPCDSIGIYTSVVDIVSPTGWD